MSERQQVENIVSHWDMGSQFQAHLGVKALTRAEMDKENPRSKWVRKPGDQTKNKVQGHAESRSQEVAAKWLLVREVEGQLTPDSHPSHKEWVES